jgi:hypothetical protein
VEVRLEDEKYVTERAYNNPKFVEDIVRDIANDLNRDETILYYKLETEALIMTSATPAADVPGQSTELTRKGELGDSAPHSGWPKVAHAVIEAVPPGIPRTK